MPIIRVDDDVWRQLQKKAEPFVDNPNSVLRRLFCLPNPERTSVGNNPNKTGSVVRRGSPVTNGTEATRAARGEDIQSTISTPRRSGRAITGTILGQGEYRQPIIYVLAQMGGEGEVQQILERLYDKVEDRLKPLDFELVPSGINVRWKIQAMYQRKKMVDDGLLDRGALKGIWRLTDAGWRAAGVEPSGPRPSADS